METSLRLDLYLNRQDAKDGEKFMKMLFLGHAFAAMAVVFASVMTIRFIGVLPSWLGVLIGILLYALTLFIAKSDASDEEAP